MARRLCLAAGFLVGLAANAQTVSAADADHAAVLAAVDGLLDAMLRRDTSAARALFVPGATLVATRPGDPPRHRTQTADDFVTGLADGTERLLERVWEPAVVVDGPLAHVWARYDFYVDGAFSHCGTDSFGLVQTAHGWRISSLAYTVQQADCPPSPLGPPE